MTTGRSLESLITKDAGLRGGRATVAGTGVTVRTIVGHYKLGLSAEEIAAEMSLPLAGVYAALAYYHLDREEIEADILVNRESTVMAEIADGRTHTE